MVPVTAERIDCSSFEADTALKSAFAKALSSVAPTAPELLFLDLSETWYGFPRKTGEATILGTSTTDDSPVISSLSRGNTPLFSSILRLRLAPD